MIERWRSRLRTAVAMIALTIARPLVTAIAFRRWRHSLGGNMACKASAEGSLEAARLAAHVDWAARKLPFETKCLPRAMALSWMLRWRSIGHDVVFAVRPALSRRTHDDMHAWVEVDGAIVLGQLEGPWIETLRLGPGTFSKD